MSERVYRESADYGYRVIREETRSRGGPIRDLAGWIVRQAHGQWGAVAGFCPGVGGETEFAEWYDRPSGVRWTFTGSAAGFRTYTAALVWLLGRTTEDPAEWLDAPGLEAVGELRAALEAEREMLADFAACAPYDVPGLPEQAMPS